MKIVILDKMTLGADIDLSPLYKLNAEIDIFDSTKPDEVEERIINADVVIVNKIKLGENNLSAASKLKLICVAATGYDNIDLNFCASHNISLCNVPGYSTESVAQLTVGMALYLVMHLDDYRGFVNSGEYTNSGIANRLVPVYHEMSSLTWGVIGGGAIGKRVADIASTLGCNVLMCRRKKDETYKNATIDEVCKNSDIISLHVPLNESTYNIINKERIDEMKDGAVFINVARGNVADESALAEAVKSGKLGGLGIDVYSKEPFSNDHPYNDIINMKNVCLTPHMAWGAAEARNRCLSIVAENIRLFFEGKAVNKII